jgi:hypothetical protein
MLSLVRPLREFARMMTKCRRAQLPTWQMCEEH